MKNLEKYLAAARGDVLCDLVVKNARVVNVFSGEVCPASVGVFNGYVAGIGEYSGTTCMDARGAFLVPGFVEGHIHVESTLLTLPEFARAVLPRGTTTAVIDPHEIANVFGVAGIKYMLRGAETCPADIFVMLPSCVPASPFESSGATLSAKDLSPLIDEPRVAGIGELMNFPAVLNGDPEFLRRVALAEHKVADGHCPGLSGNQLSAYVCAGVQTDHEATTVDEALEKLRLGMHVHIREGSTERNLADLIKIVKAENSRFTSLVTDDKHPDDLLNEGHLDHAVRTAIQLGVSPIIAIQMASINTAQCYSLKHIGAIAPGYQADFFLTDSLEQCVPTIVFKKGVVAAKKGVCVIDTGVSPPAPGRSMNVKRLSKKAFAVRAKKSSVRVINIVEHQILTKQSVEQMPCDGGMLISDPSRDILKLAVIERHHATGRVGVGLVRGLGLKAGAIGSTVAHDAHNIIVAGVNDEELYAAAEALVEMGGGFVVVRSGEIRAKLPLPVGGLMSEKPLEEVADAQKTVVLAARELGSRLENPFMTLSFLSLTPIPELKLTDQGLIDAAKFEKVGLFV